MLVWVNRLNEGNKLIFSGRLGTICDYFRYLGEKKKIANLGTKKAINLFFFFSKPITRECLYRGSFSLLIIIEEKIEYYWEYF
jgi:hypothetical protein